MFPRRDRPSAARSPGRPPKTLHYLSIILILWSALAVRVVDLERMPPFAHFDAANLADYSVRVLRDGIPWYGVRTDGDPNWAFVQYAPYVLFGGTHWALRITVALWSVLTLCAIYFGVKQMFGARVALCAMLLGAAAHLLIHFGREGTIVMPSVLSSFLTIGVFLKAQRSAPGRARALLFALSGVLLALNLYEYAAAKAVFAGVAVLWLLALPRQRAGLRPFLVESALLALGCAALTVPIAVWYAQHPLDLVWRAEALSIFQPRNAAINLKLYGTLDTLSILWQQSLRSVEAFFSVNDTSPNYHFEAPLLDSASALLLAPGIVLAFRRSLRVTLALGAWFALGLLAGAVLLIEPPTSYHYIVLVPTALIFAALSLDWIARARRGLALAGVVVAAIGLANLYLYFAVYPYKGAWYSLESDVGFYAHELGNCCSVWYVGNSEPTAREISQYIATPTPIAYEFTLDQLLPAIQPYLADDQPDVIIVPPERSGEVLARLEAALPGGKEVVYVDRGRPMFRAYTLRGRSGHRINRFRFVPTE